MNQVVYLYGFVGLKAPSPPEHLKGLEGRPVEEVELEGFRALYSHVPKEVYGEAGVSERLKELGWVGPRGLVHERVVTWFVDRGGIVPAPFLTLYSSRAALETAARERRDRIRELLDRLAGLGEWNLKVSFDPDELDRHLADHSREIQELDRRIADASPGRRYLLERKRGERAGELRAGVAEEVARNWLDKIRELSEEVRVIPLPRGVEEARVVLSAALLVAPESSGALKERVQEEARALEASGLQVEFTGPWAPYRFLDGDNEEGRHERA